jgi:hypothetical protein
MRMTLKVQYIIHYTHISTSYTTHAILTHYTPSIEDGMTDSEGVKRAQDSSGGGDSNIDNAGGAGGAGGAAGADQTTLANLSLGGAWGWLKSRIAGDTGEREEEEYEEEYEAEWDEEDDLSLAQTQGNVLIQATQGNILVAQTQGNLRVGGGNPQTIRHALPQTSQLSFAEEGDEVMVQTSTAVNTEK